MKELELRDIHLPADVSWWPPAIGWWVLLLLFILMLVALYFVIKKLKQVSVRKMALIEFESIKDKYHANQDKTVLSQQLSQLLRQVMLSSGNRSDVANLTGEAWLNQLNSLNTKAELSQQWLDIMAQSSYQKTADFDAHALLDHIQHWLDKFPKRYVL